MGIIMKHTITLISLISVLLLGALGGYFMGKAAVFERILNDKIECSLTINPITQEMME